MMLCGHSFIPFMEVFNKFLSLKNKRNGYKHFHLFLPCMDFFSFYSWENLIQLFAFTVHLMRPETEKFSCLHLHLCISKIINCIACDGVVQHIECMELLRFYMLKLTSDTFRMSNVLLNTCYGKIFKDLYMYCVVLLELSKWVSV